MSDNPATIGLAAQRKKRTGGKQRLDRLLDFLLIYLPLGLALLLIARVPLTGISSPTAVAAEDQWFLDALLQVQQEMAWGPDLRQVSSKELMNGMVYLGGYGQFTTAEILLAEGLLEELGEPDPAAASYQQQLMLRTISLMIDTQSEVEADMIPYQESDWNAYIEDLQDDTELDYGNRLLLAQLGFNQATGLDLNYSFYMMTPGQSTVYTKDAHLNQFNYAMTEELSLQIAAMYESADALETDNAFHLYMEALRLIHSGEYEKSASLLERAESRDLVRSDLAILAALGIEEPAGLDERSRSTLWIFGRKCWPLLDMLDPANLKNAAQYWIAAGRTDRLQELHQSLLQLELLLGPAKFLELEEALLDSLPAAIAGDPLNARFVTAGQAAASLLAIYIPPQFNMPMVIVNPGGVAKGFFETLESSTDFLSGMRLDPAGYTYQSFNFSQTIMPSFAQAYPPDAQSQQDLQGLRLLDWTTLVLPVIDSAADQAAADDAADEPADSATDDTDIDNEYYTPFEPGQDLGEIS